MKIEEKVLDYIQKSPCAFHAIDTMKKVYLENGFIELQEENKWNINNGGKYFVTRNNSAIIAFVIPDNDFEYKYNIISSHSDSPTFKIKENPEMKAENSYIKLNTEKYGGLIISTWFDRPLSVAGRIYVDNGKGLDERLINVNKDLLIIPNLAIHMNRTINEGINYNPQKDTLPLFGSTKSKDDFMELIAKEGNATKENIIGQELFLYSRTKGSIWGEDNQFISSSRLDDLECGFISMEALIGGENKEAINMQVVFDNEEVGSTTRQGACSTFLKDVMNRINLCLNKTEEEMYVAISKSFMISADNAHGVHPNYGEVCDPVNRPILNEGPVIKFNGNQKYCTDAYSGARFKKLCKDAKVPYQIFLNKSDMPGGSTLGNLSTAQVPIKTVDIGLAQLSMHSSYETAGTKDIYYLYKVAVEFYK